MQNTLLQPGREKKLFLNPMIRKISEVRERSETISTYGGIFGKFMYFMLMIFAGIAVALVFNRIGAIAVEPGTDELIMADYTIIGLLAAVGMFILFPFLAFLIRKTIPVTGALYCIGTGYILGFMLLLDDVFRGYMMLALALTFSIVMAMGMLYFSGRIRITDKFRAVTYTLFSTMLLTSFLLAICAFIPVLREGVAFIMDNLLMSISISLSGVIIAAMFLLIDFETIQQTVEGRLPKKYEWYAAFGFTFTVVWLYFKVLDLVTKVRDAGI